MKREKYSLQIDVTIHAEDGAHAGKISVWNADGVQSGIDTQTPHQPHVIDLQERLSDAAQRWLSADDATLNAACEQAMGVAAERNAPRTEALAAAARGGLHIGQKRRWTREDYHQDPYVMERLGSNEWRGMYLSGDLKGLPTGTYNAGEFITHSTPVDEPSTDDEACEPVIVVAGYEGDAGSGWPSKVYLHSNETGETGTFVIENEPSTDDTDLATAVQAQANVEIGELKARIEELEDACDEIAQKSTALRSGGPDPMDLMGLHDALDEATGIAFNVLHRKPIVRTQDKVQVGDVRGDDKHKVLHIASEGHRPILTVDQHGWSASLGEEFTKGLPLLNPTGADGNALPKEASDSDND